MNCFFKYPEGSAPLQKPTEGQSVYALQQFALCFHLSHLQRPELASLQLVSAPSSCWIQARSPAASPLYCIFIAKVFDNTNKAAIDEGNPNDHLCRAVALLQIKRKKTNRLIRPLKTNE